MHAGKDWHMDTDYGQASLEVGGAYLTTVAIDCLLALVSAFEKLTDLAVEDTPSTPKAGERYGFAPCTAVQCCAMLCAEGSCLSQDVPVALAHQDALPCAPPALQLHVMNMMMKKLLSRALHKLIRQAGFKRRFLIHVRNSDDARSSAHSGMSQQVSGYL